MNEPNELQVYPPSEVLEWWQGLAEESREALQRLWDARADNVSWSMEDGWQNVPVWLEAVDRDEIATAAEIADENRDLLEFIQNDEEIQFFMRKQRWHICTQHPPAHGMLLRG